MKFKRGDLRPVIYIILGVILFFFVLLIATKGIICEIYKSIPIIC